MSASGASSGSTNDKSFSVYALIVNIIGLLLVIFSWYLAYERGTGYTILGIGFVITMILAILFILGSIILSSFAIYFFNINDINSAKNYATYSAIVSALGVIIVIIGMVLAIRFGRADIGVALQREAIALQGGKIQQEYLVKKAQERQKLINEDIATRQAEISRLEQQKREITAAATAKATRNINANLEYRKKVLADREAKRKLEQENIAKLSRNPPIQVSAPVIPVVPAEGKVPVKPFIFRPTIAEEPKKDCLGEFSKCQSEAGKDIFKSAECSSAYDKCNSELKSLAP